MAYCQNRQYQFSGFGGFGGTYVAYFVAEFQLPHLSQPDVTRRGGAAPEALNCMDSRRVVGCVGYFRYFFLFLSLTFLKAFLS